MTMTITYEKFVQLHPVIKHQLGVMLTIKHNFGLEFTETEKQLIEHFKQLHKDIAVGQQKQYLETCLSK